MNSKQQKLICYCYDLLAKRRYSVNEMMKKLKTRNKKIIESCTEKELKQILESLIKANLLNDAEYAALYLDSQLRKKPVGPMKIRILLLRRGIEENIIDKTINEANLDIARLAYNLIEKKSRQLDSTQLNEEKIQARLLRYLAGNGFDIHTAFKALEKITKVRSRNK